MKMSTLIAPLFSLFSFVSIPAFAGTVISVNNGGHWGGWSEWAMCNPGEYAVGISMRVERKQGDGDDTTLNAIKLICRSPYYPHVTDYEIIAHGGAWGDWKAARIVEGGITGFRLKVERSQGNGDDTAANSIQVRNSAGAWVEPDGWGPWGNWGSDAICPAGLLVTGYVAKFEERQGRGDDTALNDVQMMCGQASIMPPVIRPAE